MRIKKDLSLMIEEFIKATTAISVFILDAVGIVVKVTRFLVALLLFLFGALQEGLTKATDALDQAKTRAEASRATAAEGLPRCETCGGVGGHTRVCSQWKRGVPLFVVKEVMEYAENKK